VGLEDRDWYREEASRAWWREAERGGRRAQASTRSNAGRISGGLILAVLVSAAVSFAGWKGYLPLPSLDLGGPSQSPAASQSIVRLG
jgi:hypothetical protein